MTHTQLVQRQWLCPNSHAAASKGRIFDSNARGFKIHIQPGHIFFFAFNVGYVTRSLGSRQRTQPVNYISRIWEPGVVELT